MRIFDVEAARNTILRRFAWDEMRRFAWDEIDVPDSLLDRNEAIFGERITPDEVVRRILRDVRLRGDAAVREWTSKIDRVETPLVVTAAQI
jgi:histidinol dehydrogenase